MLHKGFVSFVCVVSIGQASHSASTVIGESTADETLEDDDVTGKGDGDVMGLETLGCREDFEEENKDGGGPVPRLSM